MSTLKDLEKFCKQHNIPKPGEITHTILAATSVWWGEIEVGYKIFKSPEVPNSDNFKYHIETKLVRMVIEYYREKLHDKLLLNIKPLN